MSEANIEKLDEILGESDFFDGLGTAARCRKAAVYLDSIGVRAPSERIVTIDPGSFAVTFADRDVDGRIEIESASPTRAVTIDIATGEWLTNEAITLEEGARIAASVLPGIHPDQITKFYDEWLESANTEGQA